LLIGQIAQLLFYLIRFFRTDTSRRGNRVTDHNFAADYLCGK